MIEFLMQHRGTGKVLEVGTGCGYRAAVLASVATEVYSIERMRELLEQARGQRIAELGDTEADTPKLHFEIRKSGKPADLAKYLPPS